MMSQYDGSLSSNAPSTPTSQPATSGQSFSIFAKSSKSESTHRTSINFAPNTRVGHSNTTISAAASSYFCQLQKAGGTQLGARQQYSSANVKSKLRVRCYMFAGRWQYRVGLQAHLFPGSLLRMSLVPPCLITGVNIGCTAFLSALDRLAQIGKLGDTVYRQTDSGPDNDAKETHTFHCHLVRRRVVNKIVWLWVQPKHSHNLGDRYHGMVKEVVAPEVGSGGGCMAPWDMESVVQKALRSHAGIPELGCHFANWDFVGVACPASRHGGAARRRAA
eukprot:731651-Pleurochrysis_carterae.AAC.3